MSSPYFLELEQCLVVIPSSPINFFNEQSWICAKILRAHKHLTSLLLPKTLMEILAYRTYPSSPGMRKNGGLGSWLKDCPPFKAFMIDIWANGTSPVAPALCHLNSTSSTPWFHITNFGFRKLLKGDRILQLWAFCLVREGTVGTKNVGTNPGLFIKKVDWGAWNHDQALL